MRVTSEYIAYIYFKYYEKDIEKIFNELQENNQNIDLCDGYLNTKLVRDMKGYLINRTSTYKENKILKENNIALNFLTSNTEGTRWDNLGQFRIQLAFNVSRTEYDIRRRLLITISRDNNGVYYYYISVAKTNSEPAIIWKEPLNFSDILAEDFDIVKSILSAEDNQIYDFPDELLPKLQ